MKILFFIAFAIRNKVIIAIILNEGFCEIVVSDKRHKLLKSSVEGQIMLKSNKKYC